MLQLKSSLNNHSLERVRKGISFHVKFLASLLFIGLCGYLVGCIFNLPEAFYLFPIYIWIQIGIMVGPTYWVIALILAYMSLIIMLIVWGHLYSKNEIYRGRVKMWITLFSMSLSCGWIYPAIIHLSAFFTTDNNKITDPKYAALSGFSTRDIIISSRALIPSLFSNEFLITLIVMIFYTVEIIWIWRLLRLDKRLSRFVIE